MIVRSALLTALLALAACGAPAPPAPDLVIAAQGCDRAALTLTPDRPPQLLVENRASEAMVISLPDWNNSVTLAPGARGVLELQPYAWGSVDYYCITEQNHIAAGGAMAAGFVCGVDALSVRPLSLSRGVLQVEPHDRLDQHLAVDSAAP